MLAFKAQSLEAEQQQKKEREVEEQRSTACNGGGGGGEGAWTSSSIGRAVSGGGGGGGFKAAVDGSAEGSGTSAVAGAAIGGTGGDTAKEEAEEEETAENVLLAGSGSIGTFEAPEATESVRSASSKEMTALVLVVVSGSVVDDGAVACGSSAISCGISVRCTSECLALCQFRYQLRMKRAHQHKQRKQH